METLVGRLHPLIVHVPIGFLLLAIVLYLLSLSAKYKTLAVAVPVSLLLGSIGAMVACITGYVLSSGGGYDTEVLNSHQWTGMATAAISFISWLISIKAISLSFLSSARALAASLIILFVVIHFTGHLGGSLTHGNDYLSVAFLDDQAKKGKITNIDEAYVFADAVQPILKEKCGNCHNTSKKKGKLSVESYAAIIKGGKHGAAIKPGDVGNSLVIQRVSLDPEDEKFMPADGKTPLTPEEIALLKWWIENAANEKDKKIVQTNLSDEIKTLIGNRISSETNNTSPDYGAINATAPSIQQNTIAKLKQHSFTIKHLHYQPDLLDVTLSPSPSDSSVSNRIKSLLDVKDNILWLNLAGNKVSDDDLEVINQFTNLERLRLDNNPLTDKGLQKLSALQRLQALNLCGTNVTHYGISSLSKLKALQRVYVWKANIAESEITPGDFRFSVIWGIN